MSGLLSIGQVAERTGLSVHTLRLYERDGLMVGPVGRLPNGRRVYTEWDVEWLGNCTRFRASGMPWATIREFADLVRRGPGNESARLDLLRAHQRQVVERIAELTECLDVIGTKVAVYAEHVERGTAAGVWDPVRGSA